MLGPFGRQAFLAQELHDWLMASGHCSRDSDVTGDEREKCEDDQRDQHRGRRFMHVVHVVMRVSRPPCERQDEKPEHVERRHTRHG